MPHWRTKYVDRKVLVLLGIFREPNWSGAPVPPIRDLMPVFPLNQRTKLEHWRRQCYMWITGAIGPRAGPVSV
jgi:hypothetical protein